MPSQQQVSNTPESSRDSWLTPQWLFEWAESRFSFDIDLAASDANAKLTSYFTKEDDALLQDWILYAQSGWCNPPYSEPGKWLKKAWEEAQRGFTTVMLVPTPNGDAYWRESVFGKASEIIYINGRVAFELPDENGDVKPQQGNTRGSCFVLFNRQFETHTAMSWVDRDEMIKSFMQSQSAELGELS